MTWARTGTVTVTNGSATVTGVGTRFVSDVMAGTALDVGGNLEEIAAIVSDTELTLAVPWSFSTASGSAYRVIPTMGPTVRALGAMQTIINYVNQTPHGLSFVVSTKADANAAAWRENDIVEVLADESAGGLRTLYRYAAGSLNRLPGTNDVIVTSLNGGQIGGRRNYIINGNMCIDQRRNGGSLSVVGGYEYGPDRFSFGSTGGASASLKRSDDAPDGFDHSFEVEITTGISLGTGEVVSAGTIVEGYDAASLNLGTSAAKSFTLSFWVLSSITGQYTAVFRNGPFDRGYIDTYTINSANTWEYKTITVPGDAAGTWGKTNGVGLRVEWDLGSNLSRAGATGSWNSSNLHTTMGRAGFVETTGAIFRLTGVQLEPGTQATPFEHRHYSAELAMCQRYYRKYATSNLGVLFPFGFGVNGTTARLAVPLGNEMRGSPSISVSNAVLSTAGGTTFDVTSAAMNSASRSVADVTFTVSSGLVSGTPYFVRAKSGLVGYIELDSEL